MEVSRWVWRRTAASRSPAACGVAAGGGRGGGAGGAASRGATWLRPSSSRSCRPVTYVCSSATAASSAEVSRKAVDKMLLPSLEWLLPVRPKWLSRQSPILRGPRPRCHAPPVGGSTDTSAGELRRHGDDVDHRAAAVDGHGQRCADGLAEEQPLQALRLRHGR